MSSALWATLCDGPERMLGEPSHSMFHAPTFTVGTGAWAAPSPIAGTRPVDARLRTTKSITTIRFILHLLTRPEAVSGGNSCRPEWNPRPQPCQMPNGRAGLRRPSAPDHPL